MEIQHAMECENPGCGNRFDPIASRWRCPACSWKHSCCDGAPLDGANSGFVHIAEIHDRGVTRRYVNGQLVQP